jgi:dUTP pyrophosphatase
MHKFMKSDPRAITPSRAHKFDAGTDLYGLQDVVVKPGQVLQVKTGIHLALNNGETCLFWDKSGRSLAGLTILGGCIDGPYRGELLVTVANVNIWPLLDLITAKILNFDEDNSLSERIDKCSIALPYGKAITQMLILDKNGINFDDFIEIDRAEFDLLEPTDRGSKGFGSSDLSSSLTNLLISELIAMSNMDKTNGCAFSVYNKGSYFELNWGYEEGFGYKQQTIIKTREIGSNSDRIKALIRQVKGSMPL